MCYQLHVGCWTTGKWVDDVTVGAAAFYTCRTRNVEQENWRAEDLPKSHSRFGFILYYFFVKLSFHFVLLHSLSIYSERNWSSSKSWFVHLFVRSTLGVKIFNRQSETVQLGCVCASLSFLFPSWLFKWNAQTQPQPQPQTLNSHIRPSMTDNLFRHILYYSNYSIDRPEMFINQQDQCIHVWCKNYTNPKAFECSGEKNLDLDHKYYLGIFCKVHD